MTTYTLFGQPASPATLTSDTNDYTFGIEFTVSVSGATLTGIWFYSATGAAVLPSSISLWTVSGTALVHSETPSWSGAAASGWVRSSFASPPSLTSGTAYKAAIFQAGAAANWYASTANYWSSGAGSGGITNGPLSAPSNASATGGGQDTFTNSSSLAYPASVFNALNYWIDPEVTAAGPHVLYSMRSFP